MPIVDARELPDRSEIEADLVIIGGGIAGGAIARSLAGTALKIAVLESGGLEVDEAVLDLYKGSAVIRAPGGQEKPFDSYLTRSRARLLGGSGLLWGGKCVPLDPADFARRPWVAHSGWPMSRRQLQPFYDRACDLLQIGRFDPDDPTPKIEARPALPLDKDGAFFSAPRYFTKFSGQADKAVYDRFRRSYADAANITIYLHANVTELKLDRKSHRIERLDVACLNGRRHLARGRAYVLATGGIENARLLLASASVRKEGVGNRNDLVGRFFQGHQTFSPEGADLASSVVAMTGAHQALGLYANIDWAGKGQCVLASTLDGQRRYGMGACTATLMGPTRVGPDAPAIRQLAEAVQSTPKPGGLAGFYFMHEHLPNPDSRVRLGEQADALGMARVRLEWTYSKADWDGLEAGIAALAGELGAAGLARVCWPLAQDQLLKVADASRHHMGTTRMHNDPAKGVVDARGRVHGTPNLYVAGSSVFPTSGIANPTLTLVALALRMSDHLKLELGARA